ncbi:MAG TPA: hypothetical protein VFC89_06705 [Oscillospiraceae bacterium]|nr:hypothetical protein [Oscillospiraceae bacterium]
MQFLLVEHVMTPNEIMGIVLGALGGVAIILLIVFLVYLIKTMKGVSKIVDNVSEPVSEVVDALPGIIEPTQILVEGLADTVPAILDDVSTMTGEITGAVDSVKSYFHKRSRRQAVRQTDSVGTQAARIVGFLAGIMAALKQGKSKKKKKK